MVGRDQVGVLVNGTRRIGRSGVVAMRSVGSFGYNPEARRQATADVQNFLRLLFRL